MVSQLPVDNLDAPRLHDLRPEVSAQLEQFRAVPWQLQISEDGQWDYFWRLVPSGWCPLRHVSCRYVYRRERCDDICRDHLCWKGGHRHRAYRVQRGLLRLQGEVPVPCRLKGHQPDVVCVSVGDGRPGNAVHGRHHLAQLRTPPDRRGRHADLGARHHAGPFKRTDGLPLCACERVVDVARARVRRRHGHAREGGGGHGDAAPACSGRNELIHAAPPRFSQRRISPAGMDWMRQRPTASGTTIRRRSPAAFLSARAASARASAE